MFWPQFASLLPERLDSYTNRLIAIMFTGIIQHRASLEALDRREGEARLRLCLEEAADLVRGESVAVNGACLTVVPQDDRRFYADLSPETLARTTLGSLRPGSLLHIERALRLSDRLGGHVVQGHVDAVGKIIRVKRDGKFAVIRWSFPVAFETLVIEKGSICVDGVSLTVTDPTSTTFGAALIPETLERTNLAGAAGTPVNLEFDIMAKFARKMLLPYMPPSTP